MLCTRCFLCRLANCTGSIHEFVSNQSVARHGARTRSFYSRFREDYLTFPRIVAGPALDRTLPEALHGPGRLCGRSRKIRSCEARHHSHWSVASLSRSLFFIEFNALSFPCLPSIHLLAGRSMHASPLLPLVYLCSSSEVAGQRQCASRSAVAGN